MPIKLTEGILDYDIIKNNLVEAEGEPGNCTHSAGHCFGSDGGSGIADNLKVAIGRGGDFEVWILDNNKEQVLQKLIFERCQYCQKYLFIYEKIEV